MKTARTNSSLALIIVLTLASFTFAYPVAAQSTPTISRKELKVLLKTAKLPAEHQKIAAYYRQEAARFAEADGRGIEAGLARQFANSHTSSSTFKPA